ncbi:GNAT family N-acetyltransferase [Spartinivicinus ruber]|uniref:GNAT family N-acetyltransferase n=1 Tax=Spartinivicinus ruber TaxID=2683272 RepID=UPI0013D212C0|nr:GNAT family N-acetyltransferase [Spartinivicinus ruber]
MATNSYYFETIRLLVREWHSIDKTECKQNNLVNIVQQILTSAVTHSLPADWQNICTDEHAKNWIQARDNEGVTLLIIEKQLKMPIGLLILAQDETNTNGIELRIGYLLEESAWGKGFASELIKGLISWSEENKVSLLTAGVEKENLASQRILEKNGFSCSLQTEATDTIIFQRTIEHL